jgi:hypothetical protein
VAVILSSLEQAPGWEAVSLELHAGVCVCEQTWFRLGTTVVTCSFSSDEVYRYKHGS